MQYVKTLLTFRTCGDSIARKRLELFDQSRQQRTGLWQRLGSAGALVHPCNGLVHRRCPPSPKAQLNAQQAQLNAQQARHGSSLADHPVLKQSLRQHKHIIERQARSQQIAEQSLLSCLQCLLPTKSSA